jgi:septum formation protein
LTRRRRLGTSRVVSDQTPASATASSRSAQLVLASASPRRSEILTQASVPFEIVVSNVDETTHPGERAEALVERLAREKSLEVARRLPADPARPVLGADTIVVAGEDVLGKPRDEGHAVGLLSRLVGTTHRVMTAIAVSWTDGRDAVSEVVISHVEMRPATEAELVEYVAVGESLDKAGGYALQGEGRRFIVGVEGSRTNVIGLPQEETLALLRSAGVRDEDLGR